VSQSTTFYRFSTASFNCLKEAVNKETFDIPALAKSYATLQGTFQAIEFLLSKDQVDSNTKLIKEIFNPFQTLGDPDLRKNTLEEQQKFYESGGFIHYLSNETVFQIDQLLSHFPESYFHEHYNSQELNQNNIYPSAWHDDNSPDQGYNEDHIIVDVIQMKNIFTEAAMDNDYILVFSG